MDISAFYEGLLLDLCQEDRIYGDIRPNLCRIYLQIHLQRRTVVATRNLRSLGPGNTGDSNSVANVRILA